MRNVKSTQGHMGEKGRTPRENRVGLREGMDLPGMMAEDSRDKGFLSFICSWS